MVRIMIRFSNTVGGEAVGHGGCGTNLEQERIPLLAKEGNPVLLFIFARHPPSV